MFVVLFLLSENFYFSSGTSFVLPRSNLAKREVVNHSSIVRVLEIIKPVIPITLPKYPVY